MFKQKPKLVLRVFVITFALFAAFHLSLLFITSLARGDLRILNPAEFLGLTVVWPHLAHIRGGGLLFWMVLVNAYLAIYCMHVYRFDRVVKRSYLKFKQRLIKIPTVNKILDLLIGELPR
jgi:hypothetical protein